MYGFNYRIHYICVFFKCQRSEVSSLIAKNSEKEIQARIVQGINKNSELEATIEGLRKSLCQSNNNNQGLEERLIQSYSSLEQEKSKYVIHFIII